MATLQPGDSVRQRKVVNGKRKSSASPNSSPLAATFAQDDIKIVSRVKEDFEIAKKSELDFKLSLAVITVIAFITRFWGIRHPDQVVFDEVHFGKFASYYLNRNYFFDVHPPFGKLLFAFVGWLVGYNGEFLFENIGESYITNKVPYVAYRALPAIQGSLTVSAVFWIMWESGYSLPATLAATGIILFDNAHIGQTRLILLDATLILFMALSLLCYVRFYKLRHAPFSRKWWKWLLLTGTSLSCVISTKYVGVFTFFSIGVPVLFDLWDLLNVNRRQGTLSLPDFGKHFVARVIGLVVIPFFLYLFWFQVHFVILNRSGTGDDFMTPEFQETLSDNIMTMNSIPILYGDVLTIKHKETKIFLHSHTERYPLRYDDGRVSSQGQQVTGYPHNDTNNYWEIQPAYDFEAKKGNNVLNGEQIRLRHVGTNSILLTHDVASPYYPTNQEFTVVPVDVANSDRFNDTLFLLNMESGKNKQHFQTKSGHFKLLHVNTKVAMWTHTTPLPDWAFKQAEINGNKNTLQSSNVWYADDITSLQEGNPRLIRAPKNVKTLPFLRKYIELQRAMFYHNNALTSSHPYSSQPIQWPFLLRGVSFWTHNDTRQQIYFLGNPVGWWIASSLLAVFAGIIGADQLAMRRGTDVLDERTRKRLYNSTGFFFLTWAAHYLPFFIMGRQLFLHHYLPAHLASALVTGALVEFIFNVEPLTPEELARKRRTVAATQPLPVRQRLASSTLYAAWAATAVIWSALIWGFWFFAPLTYGTPGLNVEQVLRRKWLGYDLHFAK